MWRQAATDKLCAVRRAVGCFNAVLFWVRVFASDLSAALNTLDNLCATADKLRAVRRAVGSFNAVLFWVRVGCVLWAAVIIGAAVVFGR